MDNEKVLKSIDRTLKEILQELRKEEKSDTSQRRKGKMTKEEKLRQMVRGKPPDSLQEGRSDPLS